MIIGETWAYWIVGGSASSSGLRTELILWRNHGGGTSWGGFKDMEMAAPLAA
jgi:hypothetical protein